MKPTTAPKTYRVKSFGCQMNVYDGERMAELLAEKGITPAPEGEDADLVVLNTCHIREKAAEKVYSDIGRLTKAGRKVGKEPLIAVAGCVAQAEGEEIMARSPAVSMVVGPQAYHRLPEMLDKAVQGERATDTDMPAIAKFAALPERTKRFPTAFLTVQEGCDKFCTYCVVPYTRGAEISRPFADLVKEAHRLAERGAREITLLGQNVNAWSGVDAKGDSCGLDGLIRELAKIPELQRIRYTTSHPNDFEKGLVRCHAEVEKLMPYLHLPVQSGSDRILKRMNRSHTAESYLRLIERIRAARPDIVMSGDFIVGFPEETDADFEATMELVREVKYGYAYSFKYSTRPGTPAAERPQVEPAIADERLQRLQGLITGQQREIQNSMVGRDVSVLVEKTGREAGQMVGKSEYLHSVHIDEAQAEIGDVVRVRIVDAKTNSLTARQI